MKIFRKLYKWGDKYFLNFFEEFFCEIQKKFQDPYMRVDCEFFVKWRKKIL